MEAPSWKTMSWRSALESDRLDGWKSQQAAQKCINALPRMSTSSDISYPRMCEMPKNNIASGNVKCLIII